MVKSICCRVWCFVFLLVLFSVTKTIAKNTEKEIAGGETNSGLKVSVFDIDATPPVGSMLAYQQMEKTWDLSLRAKGIVLSGAGKPVVLCAVDWIGIANESQDSFKLVIAKAANTDPNRVVVHTLHQHDAPICDFGAEKLLTEMGLDPGAFNGDFARSFLLKLGIAIEKAVGNAVPVTHIGVGEAPVQKVASNRRIVVNGKVSKMRGSSCRDSLLIAAPEGVIDSMVTLISLWNNNQPVAVLSFYAVHPQSYYLTKTANPDFPGLARFYRQLEVPQALHIHFNGAGGNIAAGKYNDGSPENREILARRLAAGMKKAWENTLLKVVTPKEITWETVPVALPPATDSIIKISDKIKTAPVNYLTNNMGKLIWNNRFNAGKTIDLACLGLGSTRILFMPGELFVEYQLAARAMRPDLTVAMAAYGDYGPFYIGTKEAYAQEGYEIKVSPVKADVEDILLAAIRKLLRLKNDTKEL